jgi:hypothetical protein
MPQNQENSPIKGTQNTPPPRLDRGEEPVDTSGKKKHFHYSKYKVPFHQKVLITKNRKIFKRQVNSSL